MKPKDPLLPLSGSLTPLSDKAAQSTPVPAREEKTPTQKTAAFFSACHCPNDKNVVPKHSREQLTDFAMQLARDIETWEETERHWRERAQKLEQQLTTLTARIAALEKELEGSKAREEQRWREAQDAYQLREENFRKWQNAEQQLTASREEAAGMRKALENAHKFFSDGLKEAGLDLNYPEDRHVHKGITAQLTAMRAALATGDGAGKPGESK